LIYALVIGCIIIPYEKYIRISINIRYIALYQSKKEFGERAGITYFGKIEDLKVVQRREIRRFQEMILNYMYCFKFKVGSNYQEQ